MSNPSPPILVPKDWFRPPVIHVLPTGYPPYPPIIDPTFPDDAKYIFIQALTHRSVGEYCPRIKDNGDLITIAEGLVEFAVCKNLVEAFPETSRKERRLVRERMSDISMLSMFALMYRLEKAMWRAIPISKDPSALSQLDCADVFLAYVGAMSVVTGETITRKWLSTLFDPWITAMIGMSTPKEEEETSIVGLERFYMPALEVEVKIMGIFRVIPPARKLWNYKGIKVPKEGDVLALFP